MLWLCLYLPSLSLQVFDAGAPRLPFAVSADRAVYAANAAARRLGVRPGMRVSAAYALAGELRVRPRDEALERAALERLAAWAGQFTSAVSLAPPRALLLEIGGSLALFGGLDVLHRQITEGMAALGYRARLGIAPTPLGALLLARAKPASQVTDAHALRAALSDLPLSVLDLPPSAREDLQALGLRTVGACLRLPRAGLARRFGAQLLDYFDRALGDKADPREFYQPPPRFAGRIAFPQPVEQSEAMLFTLRRLLLELTGFVRARDAGVQQFSVTLYHHAPPPTRLTVGLLAPSRDAAHLLLLIRERLANCALREPVHEVGLDAPELLPWGARNDPLLPDSESKADPHALLERLQARLGSDAVHGVDCVAEHRPERAFRSCVPGEAQALDAPPRPLWLFLEPLRLSAIEGKPCLKGPLQLRRGPERIESGWWDGADVARDYFVAEDAAGARFWVYRERAHEPRWFLHGVFA